MKRALITVALLALGACASDGNRPRELRPTANPSALIAAEIGFAQLAQEKGQWTAFRETMAVGAEMFTPQRISADTFLKGRADPAVAVKWAPHAVWSGCDGSYGVTHGAIEGANHSAQFATVWQRQKNGSYKWLLDVPAPVAQPLVAPEMIAGKVADCSKGAGPVPAVPPPAGVDEKWGRSNDMTLQWVSSVDAAGGHSFTLWSWNGRSFDSVLSLIAPARSGQ